MFPQFRHYAFLIATLFVAFAPAARADSDDPPGRVARLSYTHGATSFSPAGEDEWVDAFVNRPLISGDRLWSDDGGRAEIEVGGSALRLGANTSFEFVNLDDRTTQVEVTQGTLAVSLRQHDPDEIFEIDTPTLAIMLTDNGRYRVEVDPDGAYTTIAVMRGSATARGDRAEYPLQAGDRIRFGGTDLRDAEQLDAFADDDFARFCAARDNRADHAASLQYVGADVVGAYDLDEYGTWDSHGEYGNVWYPSHVDADWAPYRDGHWIWQDPWGWTWVDNAPWGFAPAHYGRWVSIDHRWGWVPGPRQGRAVYAPALVVFIGGGGFSVGISVGGGGGPIGWFPLGAREVYAPPYHASRDYFTRVNVTNTTVNTVNITNVYNDYSSGRPLVQANYANRTVAGAVTAVPRTVFAGAQPVRAAAVKVDDKALAGAAITRVAAVAPTARSVVGTAAVARAKPAPAVFERKVVVQTPPPPKPVPFAARQAELQRTPGQPLPVPAVTAARPGTGVPARNVRVLAPAAGAVNVRSAAPAKPAAAAAGQKPAPEAKAPPGQPERAAPTAQERAAAAAQERARPAPPVQQERIAPTAPEQPRAVTPPPERSAAQPEQERAQRTPPPKQERAAPPEAPPQRAEPPARERNAPPERAQRTPPPKQERTPPTAVEQPRAEPAPQERNVPPAAEREHKPLQQERAGAAATDQSRAPPAERVRPTPPPAQERSVPPASPPQRAEPTPQERRAPVVEQKPRDVPPAPEQQRKPPLKKDKKDKNDKNDDGTDPEKKDGGGGNVPSPNALQQRR